MTSQIKTMLLARRPPVKPALNVVPVAPVAATGMEAMLGINLDVLGKAKEALNPERATSALLAIPTPKDRAKWGTFLWAAKAAGVPRDVALAWSVDDDGDSARLDHAFSGFWDSYDPNRPGGTTQDTLFFKAREAGWVYTARPVSSQATSAGAGDADADADADATGEAADIASINEATDVWLSALYSKTFRDKFRFDHSGRHWRMYHKGSWVPCLRGEQIEAAKLIGGKLLANGRAKLRADPDSKTVKRLMACAMRANSAGGITAALGLAQSDPAMAVSADDFDKDPALFNCANGVIDLHTGELLPHSPELMVFRQSPVAYDPAATCPQFDKFMLEISCNDLLWVEFMQRLMGYCLSGYVSEEKMFFWLGTGANGKSVLGNLQQYIMGGYGGVAPASFLMHQPNGNTNGATPDIANLAGKRMVSANEVESGSRMSGQTVKNAVSTEMITARVLYGPPFAFSPTHKLIVRGNHRPIIADNDEGLWRRIVLIPFDLNVPPDQRDQGLETRLMAEAPGILAWMVRGFQNWQRDGLRPAPRVLAASLAYRRDSDLLAQWVEECCVTSPANTCEQIMAYRHYRLWAESQGLRPITKMSLSRGLTERGFKAGRLGSGARTMTYIGFQMKTA